MFIQFIKKLLIISPFQKNDYLFIKSYVDVQRGARLLSGRKVRKPVTALQLVPRDQMHPRVQ